MQRPLGAIFPENIDKSHKKTFRSRGGNSRFISLTSIMFIVLIAVMGVLATRLSELTIIKGKYYRSLAEGNRIKEKKIVAPRGVIYDRNGEALVRNVPGTLGVQREYIYGNTFAHVLGYTGEVSADELRLLNSRLPASLVYKGGDAIGKSGIEKYYEDKIRGIDGKELLEVDAKGEYIRNLGQVAPIPGGNIHLSLDLGLAKVASAAMEGKKGAIVASIPQSGEILVLYSSPSFDPNAFARAADVHLVLQDKNMPLFNRAIGGIYPPGSTYKIITAVGGLETGAIKKYTKYEDVGVIVIGPYKFPNWYFLQYGKKEGMVDIVSAIKRSNDIYFYKAGEALGVDRLVSWSRRFGLGKSLGIDIEGEEEGVVPDGGWKKKTRGESWFLGDTYHLSIGQGDLLVTPLQVNSWTNVIAGDGKLCRPYLLSDLSNLCKTLNIKKETIELVREGMRQACSPGGTGWPLFGFKIANSKLKIDNLDFMETIESTTSAKPMVEIATACKTGTAEFGDPQNKTHAWFTIFAPVHNPQISITVLVESGGEGSSVAAPIAKKMLEEWFGR
ncbi:hypothetical protein HY407_03825 [Candidatus Gottesmanbacteria bacterium]|nr:hypothetical protein [Candidatus Gottesmanbacteria bacterium]